MSMAVEFQSWRGRLKLDFMEYKTLSHNVIDSH